MRIGKVKGVSKDLVNKYGNNFSTEFDANKKLVYQYSDITSKHLNNRVAGYITRLKVNEKKRAEVEAAEEAENAAAETGTVEIPEEARAELEVASGEEQVEEVEAVEKDAAATEAAEEDAKTEITPEETKVEEGSEEKKP
ncbi:MAG: hypothetical protein LUP94_00190 [Candidatus Methanomethylicus sp.]|nr:hypothetical protein [Candidatus Methanomethylicus sp.]